MEDFIRRLGFVNKHDEIYISDFSLRRRMLQKSQNQKLFWSTKPVHINLLNFHTHSATNHCSTSEADQGCNT
ncbi:hypothetical protein A9Q89_12465 [Gammaproteobacteria bacterium 53_120_T64]|nr:hypothetical protein A9Q89_12465 [Gammaproteobacteria bacterium 53_120_T64]